MISTIRRYGGGTVFYYHIEMWPSNNKQYPINQRIYYTDSSDGQFLEPHCIYDIDSFHFLDCTTLMVYNDTSSDPLYIISKHKMVYLSGYSGKVVDTDV